jgi:glycosyltransferase involved in cell wall biosynthesis
MNTQVPSVAEQSPSASNLAYATAEARELQRVRTSLTFQLGLEITRAVHYPPLLLLLPLNLVKRFIYVYRNKRKQDPIVESSGVFIIGIDRKGDFHASLAKHLAELLAAHDELGPFSLVSNGHEAPEGTSQITWYRLPTPRDFSSEPRDWNILAERLISSAIHSRPPKTVIFIGDYLFRGVADAIMALDSSLNSFWFQIGESSDVDNTEYPGIELVRLPNWQLGNRTQSVHRLIRRPDDNLILLLDLSPSTFDILPRLDVLAGVDCIVGVDRGVSLPSVISLNVNPSEVDGYGMRGKSVRLIDDLSPLIPTLFLGGVPTLLIRTGRQFSAVEEGMLSKLQLEGSLLVLRCLDTEDVKAALEYIIENHRVLQERSRSGRRWSHPVIEWLKNR